MISFRFHVVSITAIFLAIAIGVVVGSTYVDELTVDRPARTGSTPSRATSPKPGRRTPASRRSSTRRGEYIDRQRRVRRDRPAHRRARSWWSATRGVDEAVGRAHRRARPAGRRRSCPASCGSSRGGRSRATRSSTPSPRSSAGRRRTTREELWADGVAGRSPTSWPTTRPPSERRRTAGDPGHRGSVLATSRRPGSSPSTRSTTTRSASPTWPAPRPRMLIVTGARAAGGGRAGRPGRGGRQRRRRPRDGRGRRLRRGARGARPRRRPHRRLRRGRCCDAIVIVDDVDLEAGRVAAGAGPGHAADGQVGLHYGYGDGADAVLPAWTAP